MLFGGTAAAIAYAIEKSKNRETTFRTGTYDRALGWKDRIRVFYETLDPVSQKAAKVGLIVGLVFSVLSLVF